MKHGIVRTPKKAVEQSLQVKLAWMSVISLCSTFIVASVFTFFLLRLFNHGEWDEKSLAVGIVIVCAITLVWGGYAIWHGAMYVTNPLQRIITGVEKVTMGDFSVEIHPKIRPVEVKGHKSFMRSRKLSSSDKLDEIDLLAQHFNQMVKALAENDYITKDFINNVSHELQTPVSAISGFVEMMEDEQLSPSKQKEYISYIKEATDRLSGLAESMLLLSRLDHQAIIPQQKMVRQDELVRQVIVALQEKWSSRAHDLEVLLEPIEYQSNEELMYGIYHNLIDNSMKYTPDGKVIRILLESSNQGFFFIIEDQGIGIEADKIERIFDRFYQCDESHRSMGSGLGMSIVARSVDMMGGKILVTSETGKGTRVEVKFNNN